MVTKCVVDLVNSRLVFKVCVKQRVFVALFGRLFDIENASNRQFAHSLGPSCEISVFLELVETSKRWRQCWLSV